MALSNIMAMVQIQQRDYQTALNLAKMGCKGPENPESATGRPGFGLAGIMAESCPKDDVRLSQAVEDQLKAMQQLNSGEAKVGTKGDFSEQMKAESTFLNAPMDKYFEDTGRKPLDVDTLFQSKATSDKRYEDLSSLID